MKKIIPLLLLLTIPLWAQNINGRLSSTVYSFERFESQDVSNNFLRFYQYGNFNLNKGQFTLRTSFLIEQDFIKKVKNDPRIRFSNLYLEIRDLLGLATIKIGRQPLYNSIVSGLFDGVNLDLKFWKLKFSGFYGVNVPAYQKLALIDDWKNNYLFGGKMQGQFGDLFVGIGYLNKNYKSENYLTTRLDDYFNPQLVLVQPGNSQFEFVSVEAGYDFKKVDLNSRLFYDLNFNKVSRFEFTSDLNLINNFGINVYYAFREPLIRYNSYFTIFESVVKNNQEFDLSLNYRFNHSLMFTGKLGFVKYTDETSSRISLGASTAYGTISYMKNFGYSGELDGISAYTNYRFLNGLLTPSLGIGYSNYKLSANSEKQSALYLLFGTNIRPWRVLSFDLQGQYLNNKIYKSDFRFFFKINYWFNTNLNIL